VARYDTKLASYILDKGNYVVRVGNSSRSTEVFGYINLEQNVVTEQLKNIKGDPGFTDYVPDTSKYPKDKLSEVQKLSLTKEDFDIKGSLYTYVYKIYDSMNKLNDTELAYLCVGGFVESQDENNEKERGINGLTTRKVKSIKNYLRMADGAAGLRIARVYTNDNGHFKRLVPDPAWLNNYMYLYTLDTINLTLKKNEKEDFSKYKHVIYQHATSLPIPTAQAQSFNVDLIEKYGDIVGKEMEIFNINVLLAPAMNIHRNILCGRNFEYFSEDPLVSGKMAAALIRGVQSHKNCGTTIKHFAANNQEKNRMNNNSKMSERALREIYLKGFQIAVEEGHPTCLMTSYNLVNGVHPSENSELLIDVVRNEWNFNGLIMTDWIRSGEQEFNSAKNPGQYVYNTLKAGVNIQMTGHKIDFDYIIQSLKDNTLKREDLLRCTSKVYETIELLNK
jgi:beta-glucosidase